MILPFSTQINGKPTYFVEKIHKGITENYMLSPVNPDIHYPNDYNFVAKSKLFAKYHTIRIDITDRWKTGNKIDFFINCRQKDMFRFAPVLPVVSTQNIFMTYYYSDIIQISIDERELVSHSERLEFAQNDGFDTWDDFFSYFFPMIMAHEDKIFKGKIIHWTNLKY